MKKTIIKNTLLLIFFTLNVFYGYSQLNCPEAQSWKNKIDAGDKKCIDDWTRIATFEARKCQCEKGYAIINGKKINAPESELLQLEAMLGTLKQQILNEKMYGDCIAGYNPTFPRCTRNGRNMTLKASENNNSSNNLSSTNTTTNSYVSTSYQPKITRNKEESLFEKNQRLMQQNSEKGELFNDNVMQSINQLGASIDDPKVQTIVNQLNETKKEADLARLIIPSTNVDALSDFNEMVSIVQIGNIFLANLNKKLAEEERRFNALHNKQIADFKALALLIKKGYVYALTPVLNLKKKMLDAYYEGNTSLYNVEYNTFKSSLTESVGKTYYGRSGLTSKLLRERLQYIFATKTNFNDEVLSLIYEYNLFGKSDGLGYQSFLFALNKAKEKGDNKLIKDIWTYILSKYNANVLYSYKLSGLENYKSLNSTNSKSPTKILKILKIKNQLHINRYFVLFSQELSFLILKNFYAKINNEVASPVDDLKEVCKSFFGSYSIQGINSRLNTLNVITQKAFIYQQLIELYYAQIDLEIELNNYKQASGFNKSARLYFNKYNKLTYHKYDKVKSNKFSPGKMSQTTVGYIDLWESWNSPILYSAAGTVHSNYDNDKGHLSYLQDFRMIIARSNFYPGYISALQSGNSAQFFENEVDKSYRSTFHYFLQEWEMTHIISK
ncbi:MAG: hypothetical protein COA50_16995 [Flavobacteriaceae bacterium]|nr:MAG: hypothetical protein COA50_16995 [Flavobacteriaceae bacterium]